jgi:hypothetical protein
MRAVGSEQYHQCAAPARAAAIRALPEIQHESLKLALSLHSTIAVEELLRRSEWRGMQFLRAFN